MTVFLVKVKNAETLETNSVRQQLFDNLQPNLQPNLQLDTDVKVQDMEDRCKQLIISIDVYVLSTNELLQRYLSCNLSCKRLHDDVLHISKKPLRGELSGFLSICQAEASCISPKVY